MALIKGGKGEGTPATGPPSPSETLAITCHKKGPASNFDAKMKNNAVFKNKL